MAERLDEKRARELLEQQIALAGHPSAFARNRGISPQYLHDVLNKRRAMSGKILTALGLKKIIEFEREVSE